LEHCGFALVLANFSTFLHQPLLPYLFFRIYCFLELFKDTGQVEIEKLCTLAFRFCGKHHRLDLPKVVHYCQQVKYLQMQSEVNGDRYKEDLLMPKASSESSNKLREDHCRVVIYGLLK
jgi:hypothetical protein